MGKNNKKNKWRPIWIGFCKSKEKFEIEEILTIVGMKIMAIHIISDIGSESEIKDVDNAENTGSHK